MPGSGQVRTLHTVVTGGTGAVGPVLVARLVAAGHRVTVLARRPPQPGLLPPAVNFVAADLTTETDRLRQTMAGANVVFHLAAKLHLPNPGPELTSEYERVNVAGTRQVLDAAQTAGIGRLVFFSTISVYGPTYGKPPFDETTAPYPQTMYARTKQQAEALVLTARRPDGTPLGTVLRLAAVYGPRIKGNYAHLVEALRRGRFIPIGPGTNRRTLVFEQDVAKAAVLAATHPRAAGQIYNITGGETPTLNQIIAAICYGLGRPLPRWRMPVLPARLALGTVELGYRLIGKPPKIGRFTLDKLLEDVAISGQRIKKELGFSPTMTQKQGWLTTIKQQDH